MSRTFRARDIRMSTLDKQAVEFSRAGRPPKAEHSPLERRLAAMPQCKVERALVHARRRAAATAAATAALQAYFIGVHMRALLGTGDDDSGRAKSRLMAQTLAQLKMPRTTLRLPDASKTVAAKLHKFVEGSFREYLGGVEPDTAFIDEQTALVVLFTKRGWAALDSTAHDYLVHIIHKAQAAGLIAAPEER